MQEKLLKIIWKPIEDYEGLYEVSNFGNVRSLDRKVSGRWGITNRKGKILNLVKDKDGYLIVTLCKKGKQKTHKIHRLVANAFLDNPYDYECINHKDENPTNNHFENLEFCTTKYNSNYGTRNERLSIKKGRKVMQYDLKGNFIKEYHSVNYAKKLLGFKHIYDCCNGKLKTCGGYIWRYADGR